MVSAAVRQLRPDQAVMAAAYIRVSREVQAEGHSPDVQRAAIKKLAKQEGYILTDDMIEEDHARGSKVTRTGYQRIIEAVRAGTVHVVLCYMFDRWGRDGAEWLARAREFERLGVSIISVTEGKDDGGLIRFVRAGMAEEYSRQLAKRVLPTREKAAREGTHMGPTPLGYKRVYPEQEGRGRSWAGLLVPDDATAWLVQELFSRYAAGGWSIRQLVGWLNTDDRVPARTHRDAWTASSIKALLKNPVYTGLVRYNARQCGYYERAAVGSMFVVPGKHDGIIDPDIFDAVQRRMAAATARHSYNRHYEEPVLAAGLLVCDGCGGPMGVNRKKDGHAYYECTRRRRGLSCAAQGYIDTRAHEALLCELGRLRGAPWTPQTEKRLTGGTDDGATRAVAVQKALTDARDKLRRHTRLMTALEDDPTPEQIAVFREVSAEISDKIRALEMELTTLGQRAAHVPNLRDLHAKLTRTEIPHVLAALSAQRDIEGQRALIQDLIESARVVERLPTGRPSWLRMEITWTADVRALIDARLLRLDAPPEPPQRPSAREMQREYCRRYRDTHRDARNAARRAQRATAKNGTSTNG